MFQKLQWKLTLAYTFILVLVLIFANVFIYVLLENSNNKRLSEEMSQMLSTIEGSEWLVETSEDDSEKKHSGIFSGRNRRSGGI